ncbi:MAG TPA: XylR N-terminal domain-containing protein [candidate division Zixibacteria bacterium]|nr:XylR N-terminal domain-containing protein [candidate division Zixibacteria bacterium]HQL23781.1 XylR N-terminal domain-containing protein [candidate division Zixibacteria bacterium]
MDIVSTKRNRPAARGRRPQEAGRREGWVTVRGERLRRAAAGAPPAGEAGFDLSRELSFHPDTGRTLFRDSRVLILDANAIGMLRQNLLDTLGWAQARDFLLRFGYQHGYSDFMQIRHNFEFADEMDLLCAGPVLHTYEGIVKAAPTEIRFDRHSREFQFAGIWTNSWEAEQHLAFNPPSPQSVCWTLTGYATGWCSAFCGWPVLAMEPTCIGKGDPHCGWKVQPPDLWGEEGRPMIEALSVFWASR